MTDRSSIRALFACSALLASVPLRAQEGGPAPTAARVLARCEVTAVATERLADTDGDGAVELLLLRDTLSDRPAAMVRMQLASTEGALREAGRIALADPAHTLVTIVDLLPGPGAEVVVADPSGVAVRAFAGDGDAPAPRSLVRRARFAVRVDRPQLSPFVLDLNQDGRLDLLLPSLTGVQPYLQEDAGDDGLPRFRRLELVPVPIDVDIEPGSTGLDPELTGRLRIPGIQTEDVNGDGKPDLLTREGRVHRFHLQQPDGTFAAPIEVDIEQFVDSTPKAAIAPGSTIVLGDRQLLQRGDIDGDGIKDCVIAHRRKIWTFLADGNGPQFQKARTQAVADDVTAMLVVDLDEDERADLLTFRVQIPGIGALLLGLVRSIDIDIRAVGHASEADGFARTPRWRRTVTLRIPPLLSLIGRQDELVERFTDLLGKTRLSARGRLRSEQGLDLAIVSPDGSSLELRTGVGEAPRLDTREGQRLLRRLLFEDEETVFDLERIFSLVEGLIDTLAERTSGDGTAIATTALRDPDAWRLVDLLVGDLDGQPGDELVAVYRAASDESHRAYDVLSWR